MKRTELQRSATLRLCGKRYATAEEAADSKRGRERGAEVFPCPDQRCGAHHVRQPQARRVTLTGPSRRDTGPDAATRQAVYERDGYACVCCGRSIIGQPHSVGHRKRRSQGGTNDVTNLLTFLGFGNGLTGDDDHHHRIDQRKNTADEDNGYTVRSYKDPALISVRVFSAGGSGTLAWPTPDGKWSTEPPEGVTAA